MSQDKLGRIRKLLRVLGDPQDTLRAVHVAGTAGKGSVTAFVASILTVHGFKVGAYLSPHAYSVLERFQLDGQPVAADVAARQLADIAPLVATMDAHGGDQPSFFEVTTALAFQIFVAAGVDYAVIETGLGGLLDATNTISRSDKVAVITTIGLDHTDVLGPTLQEIAMQKAGILPRDGRALAVQDGSAGVVDVIAAEARRRRSMLQLVDVSTYLRAAAVGPDGTVLRLPGGRDLPLGLHGRHQAGNAVLAMRVVETLAQRARWQMDCDALREGLRRVTLPGRFERREWRGQPIIVDGAHNPVKLGSVVATLQEMFPARQFPWVLALKHDKDLKGVLDVIAPVASVVAATRFDTAGGDHAAAASIAETKIVDAAHRVGLTALAEPEPLTALERAIERSTGRQPTVVAGSFYLLSTLNDAIAAQ